MPIPEFVRALREKVGHELLWMPGATAVVLRPTSDGGDPGPGAGLEVLLTLRADLHVWSPVAGIVEPGEEPQATAVREAQEEAGVRVEVEALVAASVTDVVTYPNQDQAVYLDHTFRCRWVSGEAHVGDEESLDVRWWPVLALPDGMRQLDRERIAVAVLDPRPPVLGREQMARVARAVLGRPGGLADAGTDDGDVRSEQSDGAKRSDAR